MDKRLFTFLKDTLLKLRPKTETLAKYGLCADGTVDDVLDKLSSTRDLLWENPSVGSFSEQTIKLDYKKYIKVGIEFRTTVQADLNNPNVTYQEINTDSKNVVMFTSAFLSAQNVSNRAVAVYRNLTLLDDGIKIGDGIRTVISSGVPSTIHDSFTAVPTRIYGIK